MWDWSPRAHQVHVYAAVVTLVIQLDFPFTGTGHSHKYLEAEDRGTENGKGLVWNGVGREVRAEN